VADTDDHDKTTESLDSGEDPLAEVVPSDDEMRDDDSNVDETVDPNGSCAIGGTAERVEYIDTLLDVSMSLTVLLLFMPLRKSMRTGFYHPCYVEHMNFNIPKTARIHLMINSLCDNPFMIAKEEFNSFGLAAIAYDLFFFQDWILNHIDDEFKLILTERSSDKRRHNIGLRFEDDATLSHFEHQKNMFVAFVKNNKDLLQLHLTSKEALTNFRSKWNLDEESSDYDEQKHFQHCYLNTMIDFQKKTHWRFGALNGQNRLAAALSFMVGCNYDLQDWVLRPASIDPQKALDIHVSEEDDDDINKGYKIYGQIVDAIPQQQDLLVYIDRARHNPKMTSGVQFYPAMEVRVISNDIGLIENPSVSRLMECLQEISQKRLVDERMLSNTSMPAKCSQIMNVICDEIVKTYQQCQDFHRQYQGTHMKPSNAFLLKYPDYRSESDDEGDSLFCLI
jgi:hypothetical protein